MTAERARKPCWAGDLERGWTCGEQLSEWEQVALMLYDDGKGPGLILGAVAAEMDVAAVRYGWV